MLSQYCKNQITGLADLCAGQDSTLFRNVALETVLSWPSLQNKNTMLHAILFSMSSVCFISSQSALSSMLDLEEREGLQHTMTYPSFTWGSNITELEFCITNIFVKSPSQPLLPREHHSITEKYCLIYHAISKKGFVLLTWTWACVYLIFLT